MGPLTSLVVPIFSQQPHIYIIFHYSSMSIAGYIVSSCVYVCDIKYYYGYRLPIFCYLESLYWHKKITIKTNVAILDFNNSPGK